MTLQNNQQVETAAKIAQGIFHSVSKVIVGRPDAIRHAIYGMMAGGHTLFEDVPGLAKTLLVNTIARTVDLDFNRIQFTPDLLPADITGSYIYNMKDQTFSLRKGAIFTQVLLADELNRAPPKSQAALLEAMQEKQVTLEGTINRLPEPFIVFATQNPIESEGVYILPEAELDRFMLRISMGYPTPQEEVQILERVESWDGGLPQVAKVTDAKNLLRVQSVVRRVYTHIDVKRYIASLVHATRNDPRTSVGSSPRGGIAIMGLAKAAAVYKGRDFVTVDDVKDVTHVAIDHRILMRPEAAARGMNAEQVVDEALRKTPTPQVPQVAQA